MGELVGKSLVFYCMLSACNCIDLVRGGTEGGPDILARLQAGLAHTMTQLTLRVVAVLPT